MFSKENFLVWFLDPNLNLAGLGSEVIFFSNPQMSLPSRIVYSSSSLVVVVVYFLPGWPIYFSYQMINCWQIEPHFKLMTPSSLPPPPPPPSLRSPSGAQVCPLTPLPPLLPLPLPPSPFPLGLHELKAKKGASTGLKGHFQKLCAYRFKGTLLRKGRLQD